MPQRVDLPLVFNDFFYKIEVPVRIDMPVMFSVFLSTKYKCRSGNICQMGLALFLPNRSAVEDRHVRGVSRFIF